MRKLLLMGLCALPLAACTGQLASIGKAPKFAAPEAPTAPGYESSLAQPGDAFRSANAPATEASASLFRSGSRAMFHDRRASRIGDILTVRIRIADKATLDNSTTRSRDGSESVGLPNVFGLESKLSKILPGAVDPSKLIDGRSASKSSGTGQTSRQETVDTTVAAIVAAVLPNGNLVIRGRQEVRVNFELRELLISGIVRPEDISRDNVIDNNLIADARISYGGRGQITNVQQPRWGQQVFDAVTPF